MSLMCSWSGGKDSCFALMQTKQKPVVILNALNEKGEKSRSHGIPVAILKAQAKAMDCNLELIATEWKDYTQNFIEKLKSIKETYNLTRAVFGDIDIEAHRKWEEEVCLAADLKCLLPLWQQDRKSLVDAMIGNKITAIIVSCNQQLGAEFLGKTIDASTVKELHEKGVDICGENGEYHTLVLDCPLFKQPIEVIQGQKQINETGYHFLDVKLK